MGFPREHDDYHSISDFTFEEDEETRQHKTRVRKMLEDKLAKKHFQEEFDELDGDFDWDDLE